MNARKTFLLVEDDQFDVFFVEKEFREARVNAVLRVVRDGFQAVNYLAGMGNYADRERYPLPDLILLDWTLPRMNGSEFLQWLRRESPSEHRSIPVVVLSCSVLHAGELAQAYGLGATSHLIKPLSWHQLDQHLRALGISRPEPKDRSQSGRGNANRHDSFRVR